MKTIAVDFDGVIHAYSQGWSDGSCYDVPLPGAIDGLKALMREYAVFILSTRPPAQIQDWLKVHAPELATETVPAGTQCWNARNIIGITQRKLPAIVYVDDRGYLFRGWALVMHDRGSFATYPP